MTTYVAIPNGDIDQDSPITQPLLTALRDNPVAIAEGDPTAPKIWGAAMYGTFSGTTVLRNCLPVGARVTSSPTGGPQVSEPLVEAFFTALVACTVQVLLTCTISPGSGGTPGTASLVVYKNGTVIQTYGGNQSGATLNITLAAGDNVGLVSNARGGSSGQSSVSISVLQYRTNIRSVVMT